MVATAVVTAAVVTAAGSVVSGAGSSAIGSSAAASAVVWLDGGAAGSVVSGSGSGICGIGSSTIASSASASVMICSTCSMVISSGTTAMAARGKGSSTTRSMNSGDANHHPRARIGTAANTAPMMKPRRL